MRRFDIFKACIPTVLTNRNGKQLFFKLFSFAYYCFCRWLSLDAFYSLMYNFACKNWRNTYVKHLCFSVTRDNWQKTERQKLCVDWHNKTCGLVFVWSTTSGRALCGLLEVVGPAHMIAVPLTISLFVPCWLVTIYPPV